LKHLHAVLHDNDDKAGAITTEPELGASTSSTDNVKEMMTSGKN
jgi:hypothetical protein